MKVPDEVLEAKKVQDVIYDFTEKIKIGGAGLSAGGAPIGDGHKILGMEELQQEKK